MRDEVAVVAQPEPEGDFAAEIPATCFLIGLDLANALPNAIPLSLQQAFAEKGTSRRGDVAERG